MSADRTIEDFGDQWTRYTDNEGYYASTELFEDLFGRVVPLAELAGARVADIGSGTGRIVRMLLGAGAGHVVAVEPSAAYDVLVSNVADVADRVTPLRARGDELPPSGDLDFVFSAGVLHHIPDPDPVVRAAFRALRPGGRMAVWLYGREGNELYLAFAEPMRAVTRRLPHVALSGVVRALDVPLFVYARACRRLPLPMRSYMVDHLGKLSGDVRRLTIYDQLNPTYARYYREAEARALLERSGFVDVRLDHRHGYSWTVVGTRP